MKITKTELAKIVKEETEAYMSETYETDKAVPPGTNALEALQVMGNDLIKYAAELAEMPSHMPASDASGFINARGQELLDVHAEMTSGMVATE